MSTRARVEKSSQLNSVEREHENALDESGSQENTTTAFEVPARRKRGEIIGSYARRHAETEAKLQDYEGKIR